MPGSEDAADEQHSPPTSSGTTNGLTENQGSRDRDLPAGLPLAQEPGYTSHAAARRAANSSSQYPWPARRLSPSTGPSGGDNPLAKGTMSSVRTTDEMPMVEDHSENVRANRGGGRRLRPLLAQSNVPAPEPASLIADESWKKWEGWSESVNQNQIDTLIFNFQRMTLLPSRGLEESCTKGRTRPRLDGFVDAVVASLYSSSPIAFWASIPFVHVLLILVSAAIIYFNAWGNSVTTSIGPDKFRYYRFTALERRDGAEVVSPGISEFGMLDKGSPWGKEDRFAGHDYCISQDMSGARQSTAGASMILDLREGTKWRDEGVGGLGGSYSGWYFVTEEAQDPGGDPVVFRVEGSDSAATDSEDGWTTVASSEWKIYKGVSVLMYGKYETTVERGATELIVMTAKMPYMWGYNFSWMIFWIVIFIGAVAAQLGAPQLMKSAIAVAMLLVAIIMFTSGVLIAPTSWQDAMFLIGTCIVIVSSCAAYWFYESQFDAISIVTILIEFFLNVLYSKFVTGDITDILQVKGGILSYFIPFLLCTLVLCVRIKVVVVAIRMIALDKQVYCAVWRRLRGEEPGEVHQLMNLVKHLQRGRPMHARQYVWRPSSETAGQASFSRVSSTSSAAQSNQRSQQSAAGTALAQTTSIRRLLRGSIWSARDFDVFGGPEAEVTSHSNSSQIGMLGGRPRSTEAGCETQTSGDASPSLGGYATPVTNSRRPSWASISIQLPLVGWQWKPERVPLSSLDTLYSQAQLLNPVLLTMTRSYAANFHGVFPMRQSRSDTDNWESGAWPLGSSNLKARNFVLGGVKSVARCISKKDMAYRGDASRLLDICRQSIYFHSIRDLLACLTALSSDPNVTIVRIKSKLTEGLDSDPLFSGKRFVSVNLQLQNDITRQLCVDNHIAELLLIPIAFAEQQTKDMYQRYIVLRNSLQGMWWFHSGRRVLAGRRSVLSTPEGTGRVGSRKARMGAVATYLDRRSSRSKTSTAEEGGSREMRRVVPACDEGKWPPEFNSPHTMRSNANSAGEGPEEVSSLPQTDLEEGSSISGVLITPRTGQTLKAYCRLSAAGLSNMLDASTLERLRCVFTSINPSEVIATRMPLSGASVQPFFQALGLMISIFFFVMGVAQWASMSRSVHPSYAHFRIHTLETRNGTLTPLSGWGVSGWGFQEWGVLGAGDCFDPRGRDASANGTIPHMGGVLSMRNGPKSIDAWWMRTSFDESPGSDAFRYVIFGTNDAPPADGWCQTGGPGEEMDTWCGAHWNVVGGPVWRLLTPTFRSIGDPGAFSVSFSRHRGEDLPLSRGVVVTQGLVPTVRWWFVKPATSLLTSLCCLSFVAVGRYGISGQIVRSLDLNKIMTFFLLAIALCMVVAGCGYLYIEDRYANAVDCFLRIPIAIIMAVGVCFEAHFLRACWIAVLYDLAIMQFYLMFLVYGPSHGVEPWPIFLCSVLVIIVGLQLLRWRTQWMYLQEVKKSSAGYERAWAALCRSDRETQNLQALSRTVDIQGCPEYRVLRQMQRKHTSNLTEVFSIDRSKAIVKTLNPVFKDIRFFPISNTTSTSAKVTSLDQLYAQASVCSIVLAKMARKWAQETDGYLTKASSQNPSKSRVSFSSGGAEYVRPSELDEGSYLEYAARAIKSRKRALVKFMMCYGGDASRLLDLARNRIAFDSIADLHKCFLMICSHPDVEIVRVKNRLTQSYNHERTGGYRDLCINLRITEDSIVEMGAETHICELQLALTCFTNLDNPDSHKRFTNWRRYSSTVMF